MKRITFRLLAISLTFILGVTAVLLFLKFSETGLLISPPVESSLPENEGNAADSQILTYCELVNNPEKYDGKIVRLSARMSIGLENSWFYDAACGADNVAIISSKDGDVWKAV